MRPQFFHIRFGVFAPHNSLLPCFLSHSVLPIREGALLTLCYNLAMDEDAPHLRSCGFHHSNPWPCGWSRAASSGRDAPVLSEGCAPLIRGQDVPPRYRVDCVASRRVLPRERFRPLAPNGHGRMSDLSPLSGEQRKSNFGAARSVDDPFGHQWREGENRARRSYHC